MGRPRPRPKRRMGQVARKEGQLRREWYGNGKLKSVGRYAGRKRTGPWKFFHRDGKLWASGRFDDGVLTGLWSWYAGNGLLRQTGRFTEGKQDGVWKRYFGGTRQLYDVGSFVFGRKVGVWRIFNRDGSLKRRQDFGDPRRRKR